MILWFEITESTRREITQWVDWSTTFAYFEMQMWWVFGRGAYFGNDVALFYMLAFLDKKFAVVGIGAQVGFIMPDDYQVAVAD